LSFIEAGFGVRTLRFFRPFRGLKSFCSLTQGGTRFTSLALGYYPSSFQPFQFEPHHVRCLVESFSTFASTLSSILINGS